MARSDPLTRFRSQAGALRNLFRDQSLAWFDSALRGKRDDTRAAFSPESIYEMVCYFSLLRYLQPRVQALRLICPVGSTGYRFPYAPGSKDRFAFFRFEFRGRTFDLCLGTGLPDPVDPTQPEETPDISLQYQARPVSDPDAPVGKPLRIWDAKYHAEERFAKHDYQQMATWCEILGLPVSPAQDAPIQDLLDGCFHLSAVLTNAKPAPFNTRIARARGFRVAFHFDGSLAHVVVKP